LLLFFAVAVDSHFLVNNVFIISWRTERLIMKGKNANRCKGCGHLIHRTSEGYKHKQSNHSFYCPCRKPEIGWLGHYSWE